MKIKEITWNVKPSSLKEDLLASEENRRKILNRARHPRFIIISPELEALLKQTKRKDYIF